MMSSACGLNLHPVPDDNRGEGAFIVQWQESFRYKTESTCFQWLQMVDNIPHKLCGEIVEMHG